MTTSLLPQRLAAARRPASRPAIACQWWLLTIWLHGRRPQLGEVVDGLVRLNVLGRIVLFEWERTAIVRPRAHLDAFLVLPDRVVGVVALPLAASRAELGALLGGLKGACTAVVNTVRGTPGTPLWERGYHALRLRDTPGALARARRFVADAPLRWAPVPEGPDA